MIDNAVFSLLSTTAPVTDVVATRIFPRRIPSAAAYPCVAFDAEEREGDVATTGEGFRYFGVELAAVGRTSDEAQSLADLIYDAIHDNAGTWGGEEVLGAWIEAGKDQTYTIEATGQNTYYVCEKTYLFILR